MNPKRIVITLSILLCLAVSITAQESSRPTKSDSPDPRAANGKKLLTATDLLKISTVGNPRISPDGTRIAYTVGETRMEKDKEWKGLTQVWLVPSGGGKARQFTRGEKNSSAPEWSPDGSLMAFLSDREKDGERQVWMMMADGGEAWVVTSHKGGVSGFRFSPDGKRLVLTAADQPSREEEDRKKVKDDTMVIDRDIRMTHLWLFDVEKKSEKRITEGDFTVSDPQWSTDGTRITYTTRPTPKADDGDLSDLWMLTVATGEKKRIVGDEGASDTARWSPNGEWIAFTGGPTSGVATSYLYLLPAGGGTPKQVSATFDLNVGTPVWSRDSKTIYFSANVLEANEVYAVDVPTGSVKQVTQRGGSVGITEISRDGKTIVGTASSSQRPTELYVTSDYKVIKPLSDHNAWLSEYALAESQVVKWKSKDGMDIEGVLTKPVGYAAGTKVPFLLNPHGGPTGASLNNFSGTVQVLAANGFAVLQPNFRGSTGKGLTFAPGQ
jgi:dipeptidyl aminopeptidase/acylaminoacyl peptidase